MTAPRAPLFDRLSARSADATPPGQGSAPSAPLLRDSVRRELGLLFNSTPLESGEALAQLTHVARSTLNYGLPALAGRAASSVDPRWLAAQLSHAIRRFEPRLCADSVRVRARTLPTVHHNVMSFEIDASFQQRYGAETIELDSEVDLESGEVRVLERPRRRGSALEARS